ncbi:MAG: hypothetical protein HYY18_13665 [Planctomycetes bacterium]|nr:hypothetical protein [Planctomycetota bacterium]
MRRLIPAAAAAMVFLFSQAARAHDGYKFELKAGLKKVQRGKGEFAMVYVEGHAHYPDGTLLRVGIRHPNVETYLKSVQVRVSKRLFMAEIGPWEQHFPPGRYPVIVEFEFEDQSKGMQDTLQSHEDIAQCLVNNPEFQAKYKKDNPEKYEQFMKEIKANGGRCIGKKQSGSCFLEVGSPEDAERDRAEEAALLRDGADAAAELFSGLMKVRPPAPGAGTFDASDPRAWYNRWRDDWTGVEGPLRRRSASLVWVSLPRVHECLNSALLNMLLLQDAVHSQAFGDAAAWAAEIEELRALGEGLTKDQRRRRDHLAGELRRFAELRQGYERTIAENLAEAKFGKEGIEPSAENRLAWLNALKDDLGFEWEIR